MYGAYLPTRARARSMPSCSGASSIRTLSRLPRNLD